MNPYIQFLIDDHTLFFDFLPNELKESVIEYTGSEYFEINEGLRGTSELSDVNKRHVENIDRVFDLISPITEPITLFRGIRRSEYTVYRGGYVSATYRKNETQAFIDNSTRCCLIEFNVLPGSKLLSVESISLNKHEKEFILDRRGSFTITSFLPDFAEPFYGRIDKYLITYVPDVLSTIPSPAAPVPRLSSPVAAPLASMSPLSLLDLALSNTTPLPVAAPLGSPSPSSFLPPSPMAKALSDSLVSSPPSSSTLSPQESPWDVLSEDESYYYQKLKKPRYK